VPYVFHAAGGKIVHQQNFVSSLEHSLGEMGPDESSTAGDQSAHEPPFAKTVL
jgi:hypothetical protein